MKEKIRFKSNGRALEASLSFTNKKRAIIFLPGISGGADSEEFHFLEDIAQRKNYSLIRMDFAFQQLKDKNCTIRDCAKDVENLLEHLKKVGINDLDQVVIIAKSFGALVAHFVDVNADKMVLMGPFMPYSDKNVENILNKPLSSLELKDLYINRESLDDNLVLILHGNEDEIIDLENSKKICDSKPNYYLKVVKGAKHTFENEEIEEVTKDIEEFI